MTVCSTGYDGPVAQDKSVNSWNGAQGLEDKGPQLLGRGGLGSEDSPLGLQWSRKLVLVVLSAGLLSAAVYKASRLGRLRGAW